jgi:uncharacterized membrane protein YjgN (DUF898 family)
MNEMSPPSSPGAPPAAPSGGLAAEHSLAYDGRAGDLGRIAVTNGLLSVLTLGIYRFWAKTRLRRYLWGRIAFLDDPLEYSGTGLELFLGFLVALVILAPLLGAAVTFEIYFADSPGVVGVGQLVQAFGLLFLVHVAIYRARRYRLTRTQWRGIRAGQTGSATKYALLAIGWSILVGLTFGLAYPVFRTRMQKYRLSHTWFGDRPFTFEGRASEIFGSWIVTWLLFIPTFGLIGLWYRVREFRYFASRTRCGLLSFRSELTAGKIYLIHIVYLACLFVFFFLVAGVFYMVAPAEILAGLSPEMSAGLAQPPVVTEFGAIVGVVALFIVVAVLLGMLQVILYLHPLFKAVVNSLRVIGEEDYAAIAQSEQVTPSRGEGLADALDVSPF